MGYKFEKYSIGGGGNASLPPNQLHEGSTAEEIMAALEEYFETGKVMTWTDSTNYETCFWVTFLDDPFTLYFMKGSTKQLVAVAIGDTVSWSYIDLAGDGGASEDVVQIVKTNFEGGVGYEESGETEIVSEQTITVPEGGDPFIFPSYLPLTVGNAYTVNFDGTLYECVATATTVEYMGDVVYLGNAGMMGMTPETSEPFFLMNIISASMSGLLASDGEHIFSLSGYATVTRKIDPKYLDTIGKAGTGMNAEVFNRNAAKNASGAYSHAEGGAAIASGDFAHAEGVSSTASGEASHTEGSRTTASNDNAHAEGSDTVASGYCSHAEGFYTIASGRHQHAQGQYNIEDTEDKYAHIVGNGNATTRRSNAHTVDWDGNAWFAGTVEGTALILKSPSGKRFKIAVDDSGTISATEVNA